MLRINYITAALLIFITLTACKERRTVDDQGRTSACWVYAMLTCIEHESALKQDSVMLSRHWLIAKELEEQTEWMYLTRKGSQLNCRGVGPEVIRLIDKYGLVPYQNEKTQINSSSVLEKKLYLLARQAKSIGELRERMKELLPKFTISTMGAFYYLSMRYNPHQFAESIMYRQRWQFYASVPYHPQGEEFALEVADNYNHHEYTNLSIDSLTSKVLASVKAGHAVYWEIGRRGKDGHMSSDHAMAIVGMKKGMFLCKNSYGKKWGKGGYCLVSIEKFKETTCNVGINEYFLVPLCAH